MTDAFITTALRTPVGRAGGALAEVRADDLAAIAVKAVVERSGIPPARIEELRTFLFFTIFMGPMLAVIIVGGYGFFVWMYQLIAGPPGS